MVRPMKRIIWSWCQIIREKIAGRIWKNKYVRILLLFLCLIVLWHSALKLSLYFFPLPLEKVEQNYSTVYLASNGDLMHIMLSADDKYRIKLKLEDISDYIRKGFILYEDRFFYYHPGINPVSIVRALFMNIRAGKAVAGGSTITMQIARMMEPKERTVKSKLIEIGRALQLESTYTKKELLEIYLNMVPLGGNIEGVGAASYLYFGKPASELSLGQSALFIGMPKSPNQYRPDVNPEEALRQRKKVLDRICRYLTVPAAVKLAAVKEPIPDKRFDNPFSAPNLVMRTRFSNNRFRKRFALDVSFQKYCESLLIKQAKELMKQGCYNGALIAVNNHTMEVLAYIGTVDFADREHGGQINGCNIKRSPGSLLKPFLYATAIERGLITPKKVLFDIEEDYDGYKPANYTKKCIGPVSAEEALIRSLNIPAVNLEHELGKYGLQEFIRHTRLIDEKRKKIHPGLSIVLGAYPLTLEELVTLYASLANGGRLKRLQFFKAEMGKKGESGRQILGPESCYIISQMLSNALRPDLPQCWEFTAIRGKIAFKTGTSFGLRDAWCIGYNPDYTIGVWFGNVDNSGSSALVGYKAAAPVVVDIFNYLTRYHDSWFKKPSGVDTRRVCAASGDVAGPYCKDTLDDYFIPGISSNRVCSVHRKIYVRKSDGVEVCRYCMDGSPEEYQEEIVEIWPPEIASFFRRIGKEIKGVPKHNPSCPAIHDSHGLKIRSPQQGEVYIISNTFALSEQKIKLEAECDRVSEKLFWLLDGSIIAEGSADDIFFIDPEPGVHSIAVMDSMGRSDSLVITIQREPIKIIMSDK
jgi:penicillin-binding protein 1C